MRGLKINPFTVLSTALKLLNDGFQRTKRQRKSLTRAGIVHE